MSDLAGLAARLDAVRARIAAAAARAGRSPSDVTLLAVSKGQPVEALRAALDAGQLDFGENYAQELEAKHAALGPAADGARFHFIGRLQRNKVAKVIAIARVVHAVDRAELAQEISRRAAAAGLVVRVFAEVNVGGEASKGGCAPAELGALLDAMRALPALEIGGLMTIPPEVDTPEAARPYFAALRALRDAHGGPSALPGLSMGMSHDFEIAVEEGATIVRVGTAIFGARAPR
ncbi:MAG TPA: YggS family pyridoxal phosphate-dependent enzyme [Minicystis sp.]|nr:YggS family pyridoxal phosphate-dependent enzyme [Minicystis sp.]